MTNAEAEEIITTYKSMLRRIKDEEIDLGEAPSEVQEAALKLHQFALLYWMSKRYA